MIWLGQMVSGIASSITAVALPIWIFSITDSGTAVAFLEFFFFGSYLLVVLFAGILIDRSDRKTMMLMYDFLSLSGLAVLLVLQTRGAFGSLAFICCSGFPGHWLCVSIAFLCSCHYNHGLQKAIYPRQWTDVTALRYTGDIWSAPGRGHVCDHWV